MENEMDEHTPAPWFIEQDDDTWILYGQPSMGGGHPIQILKAPKKSIEYAEYWPNEADANLIAAAPDMLEALVSFAKSETLTETRAALQLARAAIEKASGKTA